MKHNTWAGLMLAAVASAAAIPTSSEATRYVAHGSVVSGPASVRVWVEGGDVFSDYGDVTLWVRPERDCYTSLFLVDTAGFIHVLNVDDGWLYGGRTYGYRACDLGLDRLHGRGIAYVFAVGSPMPFDYSYYGAGIHVGGFGFRIVGDPFVGCREFYMSLLPVSCRWDYVGVSFTRFYVREWVRYPSYLCVGGHVRVGDWCRHCEPVYANYRCNVAAPYEVLRPVARYKDRSRYTTDARHVVRAGGPVESRRHEPIMQSPRTKAPMTKAPVVSRDVRRVKSTESVRVVSTSREIARGTRVETRPTKSPVAVSGAQRTASEPAIQKDHGRKAGAAQSGREKGARKKTRGAE